MTYRAAIVGAGAPVAATNANLEGFSIGYSHARGYLACSDVDIVAIADINEANAQALASFSGGASAYTSLAELLAQEQVDILSVCTWPTLHAEMVLAAIEAGVRVILCEKPMAVSVDEIDRMVTAADAAGARLFVNHQRRYEQPYAGARRLIDAGHLGELVRVEGYVGDGWDLMSWGSHWVDMCRFLNADRDVSWVLAAADSNGNVRYGHFVEDHMLLQFGFADNSTLALVHTGAHTSGAGLIVIGTKGTMHLSENSASLAVESGESSDLRQQYLDIRPDSRQGFVDAIADIVSSIADGGTTQIEGVSGHLDTEIMMAAYASARDGHVKTLPLSDRSIDLRAN
ncbi:Gfo/Idh/MocA family protein [Planctomonas psychrotolerans]|uniref:Gfo/Idh/MocA family protein n=1 Tax=Planctomonas psychrotolerans TaxID=2528712 RepID=UPI001D0D7369|nr:Gfo/Idh/MocA family oxidoreductase [Planctomonas psychrotolerans]